MLVAAQVMAPVVMVAVIGVADAAMLDRDAERTRQEVESESAIEGRVRVSAGDLSAVAGLFRTGGVQWREFRDFVRSVVQDRSSLRSLAWLPRVAAAERLSYEQRNGEVAYRSFAVRERDAAGRTHDAGARAEYFPVQFFDSVDGDPDPLGLDLAANAQARAAMARAHETGQAQPAFAVDLGAPAGGSRLFVFLPVYREGSHDVLGFVMAVVLAPELRTLATRK